MFYFSISQYAEASGEASKDVTCEKCQAVYRYILQRTATKEKSAPYLIGIMSLAERTQEAAEAKLRKKLRLAVDSVPCPICGWIQSEMNLAELNRRYGWLKTAPYYLFVVTIILYFILLLALSAVVRSVNGPNFDIQKAHWWMFYPPGFLAPIGPVLYYRWVRRCARRFDLNEQIPETKRIAQGRHRAVVVTDSPNPPNTVNTDALPWRPLRRLSDTQET